MRLAIVTNILTPYRINFFDELNKELKSIGGALRVFAMCKEKSDRPWKYEELKREYTEVLPGHKLKVKGVFIFFNKVKKALIEYKPDIVICAGSYWLPTTYRIVKLSKKLNYKVYMWTESHDKEQKNNSSIRVKLRERIRENILKKFDGFLYASNLARLMVERYAHPQARYIELPNTVDSNEFHRAFLREVEYREEIRQLYQLSPNDFVFFTAARLSPEKGLLDFIKVANKLDDETKGKVKFLIAGTGPLKDSIQESARTAGLQLLLIGQKSQEEIIKCYAASDCFLLPSLSDPNPLSVIECLWAGKSLLISDGVGNQYEAVQVGENGFVFTYKDETGALEAIYSLVNSNQAWRMKAKEISLRIANDRYDTKKVIASLLNQFQRSE